MKALTIAGNNLRRAFRQRENIFFVFVFPMLLILVLGATFGGGVDPKLGVLAEGAGPLGDDLVEALEATEDLEVDRYQDAPALRAAVERGTVQGGVLLPEAYTETLRAGGEARLKYLLRPDQLGQQLRTAVESAVGEQGVLLRAARFASDEAGLPFEAALEQASSVERQVAPIDVDVRTAGEALFSDDVDRFGPGASSQLLLFIFLTSMTGAVALIETRRLGLSRRMLSTPTSSRTVVVGEMLGRFGVALVQGIFIMLGSLLLFGVSWGDPLGAAALLAAFALVAAGAGMLVGSLFATEQQAVSVGLLLGLGLGALGGSMVPLEVFSDTMRAVAHLTPHAWALDGFADLTARGEGVRAILPELGVLVIFAAVLLSLAAWRLRRAITG